MAGIVMTGLILFVAFFTGPWEGIVFSFAFLLTGLAAYGLFRTRTGHESTEDS
jgi:hypothetical protein